RLLSEALLPLLVVIRARRPAPLDVFVPRAPQFSARISGEASPWPRHAFLDPTDGAELESPPRILQDSTRFPAMDSPANPIADIDRSNSQSPSSTNRNSWPCLQVRARPQTMLRSRVRIPSLRREHR